jgi:hypothetical protein
LLVRKGGALEVEIKPVWRDLPEEKRFALMQRIALAATRTVNAAHSVSFEDIAAEAGLRPRTDH